MILLKFGIGTVQFGMVYGAFNQFGQTSDLEIKQILNYCSNLDCLLDTAVSYGLSEELIGQYIPIVHNYKIVTKTPVFKKEQITNEDILNLKDCFKNSLIKLRQDQVYGLLVHHADDLLTDGGERLFEQLIQFKENGLTQKIGVSVYNGEQIVKLMQKYNNIDIVQLPINVFDQRLLRQGHLNLLKDKGIEIHARSLFLQGLLITEIGKLHSYFDPIKFKLQQYDNYIKRQELSLIEAALNFVKLIDEIDVMVIGVETKKQLFEIIQYFQKEKIVDIDYGVFAIDEERFLNPSNWVIS